MSYRINAEVVYFKSNKNSCLLERLEEIDSEVRVDRKGAKKQKRVRYVLKKFSSLEHLQNVKQKLEQLLEKAPVAEWSVKEVSITV